MTNTNLSSPNTPPGPQIKSWATHALKANPLWPSSVAHTPEATEIRNHILTTKTVQTPLAVLSNGVILDGRIRFEAATVAGLNVLPVLVHAELDHDPAGQIRFMLRANGLRRIMPEFARALLAMELKKELQKEAKENQKKGGTNGAVAKHGLPATPAVTHKINARDDAAREIGQAGSWLGNAEALRKKFLAGKAPVWRLYEASIGAVPVLRLTKAYELCLAGVSVEEQQAFVEEILKLKDDEQRRAARLRAEELLAKLGCGKPKKKSNGQAKAPTAEPESVSGPAADGSASQPAKPDSSTTLQGHDPGLGEIASLEGILGSALNILTNKSKFEIAAKALAKLQGQHDPRAQTIELAAFALMKLVESAKQQQTLVGGQTQAA